MGGNGKGTDENCRQHKEVSFATVGQNRHQPQLQLRSRFAMCPTRPLMMPRSCTATSVLTHVVRLSQCCQARVGGRGGSHDVLRQHISHHVLLDKSGPPPSLRPAKLSTTLSQRVGKGSNKQTELVLPCQMTCASGLPIDATTVIVICQQESSTKLTCHADGCFIKMSKLVLPLLRSNHEKPELDLVRNLVHVS